VIEAHQAFDKRQPGWIKVALEAVTPADDPGSWNPRPTPEYRHPSGPIIAFSIS